jgi:hypothetical protein
MNKKTEIDLRETANGEQPTSFENSTTDFRIVSVSLSEYSTPGKEIKEPKPSTPNKPLKVKGESGG